jgi:chaperonin GroEL
VAAAGKAADIKDRVESIRQQIEEATSDYDKEKIYPDCGALIARGYCLRSGAGQPRRGMHGEHSRWS